MAFGIFAFLGCVPAPSQAPLNAYIASNVGVSGTLEGPVTAVASQSPATLGFTATSPNRPVWKDARFSGGKPSIHFPDSEVDYLTASSKLVCPNGFSSFVVFKTTGTDTTTSNANINPPMTILGDHSTTNSRNQVGLSGGNVRYCYKVGGTTWTTYSGSGDTLNDGGVHTIAVIHKTDGSLSVYADGVLRISETGVTYDASQTGINRIGAGYNSQDQVQNFDLAELKVWDGAIEASSVAGMHSAAMAYWAGVAAPSITSLSYSQFATDGIGKPVTVTGTNLSGATKVTISGVDITPTSSTSTTVVFTPPARTAASSLSLTVTTPGGTSNALTCSYWGPEAASVTALHDFDPADASKRTLVSGKVSVLLDRIGAMHMRQATDANRPTLVSSDAAYGGVDTLSHSSSYLIGDATTAISGPVSILVIGNTTAGSQCLISKDTNTAPYDIIHSSGVRPRFYSDAGNLTASTGATVSSPSAVLFTDSMSGSSAANLYNVDLSTPLASGTTRWGSITALAIGLGIAGLTNLTGKIARVIVWGGVLSADDKAKLADYLNNARGYGLSVTASAPSFAVTSISPTSGTERGGTSVTITGTGFTGATSASVGGLTLNSFTVVNDTTITGTTKMQTPGLKSVSVTNGTTATLTSGYTVNEVGLYTSGVKFRGINRAGPEYGEDWDGWSGQTYYEIPSGTPLTTEIAKYKEKGFNIIRLPFSWVRMQHSLNGSLHAGYSAAYKTLVEAFTNAGLRVIVECHAYMRYATGAWSGESQVGTYTQRIMGDGTLTSAHLVDLWSKVAALFASNHYVYFGLMNEPHNLTSFDSTALFASFNAQIAAIRSAGAKQLILVSNSEGSEITHWNTWSPNGGPLDSVAALDIVDSENNYAFEHHVYIADPGATSFSSILATVTSWSRTNGRKAIITEGLMHSDAANGSTAWSDLMTYLNANNDVWLGVLPWNLPPHSYLDEDGDGAHVNDTAAMAWYAPFLTPNKVT